MDAATKRIAEGLQEAMRAEHEGHHFYRMIAAGTPDPQGQEVFARLAEEEREHYRFLEGQLKALEETGRPDASLKLGLPQEFTGDHPIFSDAIKERIGSAHFEVAALGIGVQLELSAVTFYQAQADGSEDPQIKDFYNQLASWENGHLLALQKESDALKEEYWQAARFEPF